MPERSKDWINQAIKDLKTAPDTPTALNLAARTNTSPERMLKMLSFVAEESLNSVKVFWLDQASLLREIHTVAREVAEKDENIRKIVLFGSLAEKKAVPGSDADILIVLREDAKPFMDRMSEWLENFSLDFPVEIFPYTEKERKTHLPVKRCGRVLRYSSAPIQQTQSNQSNQ